MTENNDFTLNLKRGDRITFTDNDNIYRFIGYDGMEGHLIVQDDDQPEDSLYGFGIFPADEVDKVLS